MIHALKPIRTGRRSLLAAVAACLACAAPASADAGKVLVFTGTAGPANAASAPAAAAVQALGAANGFTVDVTSEATAISTASLSQYRAVAFVHSAGNVLDGGQQAALQDYVVAGGGFVGVGETAKLEEGEAFFDTLIGLKGEIRTTASSTSPQDVEFLDRVHPATRSNPLVWKGHTDTYYKWAANPTGRCTPSRACASARCPTAPRSPTTRSRASRAPTTGSSPRTSAPSPGAATSAPAAPSTPRSAAPPPRTGSPR